MLGMHADYQNVWIRVLKDGELAGDFRPVPKLQIKVLLGMYFYSFLWVRADGPVSLKSLADSFADIVLKAVKKEH